MKKIWSDWLETNKESLNQGYEKEFASEVLAKINGIEPIDIITQYSFKDSLNKNRRIDFLIRNKSKGFLLAIELDGTNKDRTHKDWAAFLERQNDLLEAVGPLLRFSNKQFFDDPIRVIRRIEKTLDKQRIDAQIRRKNTEEKTKLEKDLSRHQAELDFLENKIKESQSAGQSEKPIKALQSELSKKESEYRRAQKEHDQLVIRLQHDFQKKIDDALAETQTELEGLKLENEIMNRFVMIIAVIAVTGLIFMLGQNSFVGSSQAPINNFEKKVGLNSKSFDCSKIDARNAHYCTNKSTVACGPIVQIKRTSKNVFLNLYDKYPNSPLTVVIWKNKIKGVEERIGTIDGIVSQTVCASGVINKYKDTLRIEIKNPYALRVMEH
ncbi:MAG: hypothetical protein P8J25_01650 [Porticoccaceae bacterium]|nr:hypothetical protein [Porticoccaceae bacterium]